VTIAAEWWQVGGFWVAVAAVLVSLSVGVAGGWIASRNIQKRRLFYAIEDCVPLIADAGQRSGIQVLHNGREVKEPHLTRIIVASKSRQDIDDSNFRNGRSIHLVSTAPVLSILQVEATPSEKIFPTVRLADSSTVEIEPGVIAKNHIVTIELLTEGLAELECRADMANVEIERMKSSVLAQVDWTEIFKATLVAATPMGRVFRL
jgi:hypothetical protein